MSGEPARVVRSTTQPPLVLCPKCGGQKHVSKPPYIAGDQASWVSGNTGGYACPLCHGSGAIRG